MLYLSIYLSIKLTLVYCLYVKIIIVSILIKMIKSADREYLRIMKMRMVDLLKT